MVIGMANYALIVGGIVENVVIWDGVLYDEETGQGWSPPEGTEAVELHEGDVAHIGLGYADGVFEQPPPVESPPPSAEEILATNTATKNSLLANATLQIAPLQDAVDLGEATPEETALLMKWKQYRVAVNRVILTVANPVWPVAPV